MLRELKKKNHLINDCLSDKVTYWAIEHLTAKLINSNFHIDEKMINIDWTKWWSNFKQRQELWAASQENRTKTSWSDNGGALGQPPRCGHLCHRLLGRGHVQCHVSWHRDRGNVKDAAIFPLNINYIICNIYLWLILRCSRKLSLVEGRFSKWF